MRPPSWSVFLACMFLGMGIGMLFNHSGAGTIIGMGVGFILMGILGREEERERGESVDRVVGFVEDRVRGKHRFIGVAVLCVIGLGFILLGLNIAGLLSIPEYIWRSIGALFFIVIGSLILFGALTALKKK